MDKETRNMLRNTVTQCRRILEEAVGERLEGQYGIHASGKVEAEAHMGHLSPEDADYRGQLLVHVGHIQAGGYTSKEAVAQLVREVAFTHLNRLVAYKMMERRGLIREAVSRGVKSPGFLFYLADHPTDERLWSGGQPEVAYRHFLEWLGRTLAEEIRPLFAPHDPANPLFPPPRALDSVLALLNAPELADIWDEDETIGWVYQYFTPDELRRAARAASSAPRNSYELAFRNQFYTPRYVVEFLSDNTLGRIWYEMRQGDTRLTEQCRYLVRRPNELFMAEGEAAPVNSDQSEIRNPKSEIVPVPFRRKKDPRHLKILDPAGGSGHFLLYCFDLLTTIYEEAYEDAELGPRLQADYPTLADLRRALPGLILRHNLHLIDIDRRATQIAALALWLRAQRAYQAWQIPADQRPPIRKANIVCAEPMPGDKKLLAEFVAGLNPPLLGQLVQSVFEKMTLVGEAGSLLKIEVELRDAITRAQKEWKELQTRTKGQQMTLFALEQSPEQMAFDLSGISDVDFWDKVEELVLQALADYTAQTANGKGLARQLFAEDAVQGFGFIDLFQKQFDVALMNPPFGFATQESKDYLKQNYPHWNNNLLCSFLERMHSLSDPQGKVGAIYDRTAWIKVTYEDFRRHVLLSTTWIESCVDLGWEVLDANVEVVASITSPQKCQEQVLSGCVFDVRMINPLSKDRSLQKQITDTSKENSPQWDHLVTNDELIRLPNAVIGYDMHPFVRRLFKYSNTFEQENFVSYVGAVTRTEQHYLLFWERSQSTSLGPNDDFCHLYHGGEYSRFYLPPKDIALFGPSGSKVDLTGSANWRLRLNSTGQYYFMAGVGYGKRGHYLDAHFLRQGHLFTNEGISIPISAPLDAWYVLGLLNSSVYQLIINSYCGQHKLPSYLNLLPYPKVSSEIKSQIAEIAHKQYELLSDWYSYDPTTLEFVNNLIVSMKSIGLLNEIEVAIQQKARTYLETSKDLYRQLNRLVEKVCQVSRDEELKDVREIESEIIESGLPFVEFEMYSAVIDLVDFIVGVIFGLWDVRLSMTPENAPKTPSIPNSWLSMPSGALQNSRGLLAATPGDIKSLQWIKSKPDEGNGLPQVLNECETIEASPKYPIPIKWDGLLVDDYEHEDDIVRKVQQMLEILWGNKATIINQQICKYLGLSSLREYFRITSKGGFWANHIARYSTSRRKAPIYWLLQSSKGNYALWLYYHRLDKDIYYKALVNYVEPKLRLEENKLNQLQSQRASLGTGGSEVKQLEKEIARQEAFLSELRDFHDKLRAVAHLNLDPDLNDGVILNIAPLRQLVPWKDAQAMWEELQAGKYEWSSISRQLQGLRT